MAKDVNTIDVGQVVSYLSHSFAKTSEEVFGGRSGAVRGTDQYNYQVDFCYLVDEIERGPRYLLPKVIGNANDLIARMKSEGQTNAE